MRTQSQTFSRSRSLVQWSGVAALAALVGAFTLSWVIYRIHLAGLLSPFGFSPAFASNLLVVEALLAIGLEPLMGKASDRLEKSQGSRFLLIASGVVLSAVCLFVIPAWVGFAPAAGLWRGWLPLLLLGWAIAMSVFRSPAIALLAKYASAARLPQAASLLTIATGLAGAVLPLAKQIVLDLGATVTFSSAAILLLVTAAALRTFNPLVMTSAIPHLSIRKRHLLPRLGLIFVTGLTVTLAFRLAIETFPKVLKSQLPQISAPLLVGTIFVTLALAALPAGGLAVRWGHRQAMLLGLVGAAVGLGLMRSTPSPLMAVAIAIGLGISFSLVTNGTLPYALSLVPQDQAGLGIGGFFGGAAAATSLYSGILSSSAGLSPISAIWLGIAALLMAGLCVLMGDREIRSFV